MTGFQLLLVVLVIVIIWISNSLNVLREYERGVIFRIGRLLADLVEGRRAPALFSLRAEQRVAS